MKISQLSSEHNKENNLLLVLIQVLSWGGGPVSPETAGFSVWIRDHSQHPRSHLWATLVSPAPDVAFMLTTMLIVQQRYQRWGRAPRGAEEEAACSVSGRTRLSSFHNKVVFHGIWSPSQSCWGFRDVPLKHKPSSPVHDGNIRPVSGKKDPSRSSCYRSDLCPPINDPGGAGRQLVLACWVLVCGLRVPSASPNGTF